MGLRAFTWFRVQGSGFKVQSSGFSVQGSKFRVQGSGLRVGFGCEADRRARPIEVVIPNLELCGHVALLFGVWSAGFRVYGLEFGIWD